MADIKLPNGGAVSLPDKKQIVKQLDEYHKALNMLEPVVNQFHAAFGNLGDVQTGITDAKNAIVKAKAALSQ